MLIFLLNSYSLILKKEFFVKLSAILKAAGKNNGEVLSWRNQDSYLHQYSWKWTRYPKCKHHSSSGRSPIWPGSIVSGSYFCFSCAKARWYHALISLTLTTKCIPVSMKLSTKQKSSWKAPIFPLFSEK